MLVEVFAWCLASQQTKKVQYTLLPGVSLGTGPSGAATSKCLQHCTTGSRGPAKDHSQYNVAINRTRRSPDPVCSDCQNTS